MKLSCVLKSGPQMELLESSANTMSAGFPPHPLGGRVRAGVGDVGGAVGGVVVGTGVVTENREITERDHED